MAGVAVSRRAGLRGKWLWATLAVAAAALVMLRLSYWQVQRLEQRRANNAYLLARLQQPAVLLDGSAVDAAAMDMRKVVVRGTYDYSQEVILRNQSLDGAPGVHAITPLRISGSRASVLVDRGWIPFEQSDAAARVAFDQSRGEVEVRGLIHQTQVRLNSLSPADPPLTADRPRLDGWFRVDIPRIQQQISYPLLSVYVEEGDINLNADALAVPSTDRLPRPDIQIDLSDGPHLSYAIQWVAFAVTLLVGYTVLLRRHLKEE